MEIYSIVFNAFLGIILFFIGASIASFLGVINYRINRGINVKDIVKGESVCEGCERKLEWHEKFPVIGWILDFGKCPTCNHKISIYYPISETVLGIIFVLLFFTGQPFYYYPLFSFLFLFTISDLEFMEIPKVFVHYGLIFGFLVFIYNLIIEGSIASVIIGLLLAGFIFIVNKVKYSFGFGDVLIFLMLSFILSIGDYLVLLFVTFLTGALVSLMLVAFDRTVLKKYIPFVPFIMLGLIFTMFVNL